MTKSDLILKITNKNSFLYQKDIQKIVDCLFQSVTNALKNGDRVELRGFGTFGAKFRKARVGRNPKTGDPVAIPQKKLPFLVKIDVSTSPGLSNLLNSAEQAYISANPTLLHIKIKKIQRERFFIK